jgi:hypothetical protein
MRPETLMEYVRKLPAVPFRIVMNSGRTYDVRHRDLIGVARDHFLVFSRSADSDIYDRYDVVSLLLVERLEIIEPQPAPADRKSEQA